jgi:hypothetical protein
MPNKRHTQAMYQFKATIDLEYMQTHSIGQLIELAWLNGASYGLEAARISLIEAETFNQQEKKDGV